MNAVADTYITILSDDDDTCFEPVPSLRELKVSWGGHGWMVAVYCTAKTAQGKMCACALEMKAYEPVERGSRVRDTRNVELRLDPHDTLYSVQVLRRAILSYAHEVAVEDGTNEKLLTMCNKNIQLETIFLYLFASIPCYRSFRSLRHHYHHNSKMSLLGLDRKSLLLHCFGRGGSLILYEVGFNEYELEMKSVHKELNAGQPIMLSLGPIHTPDDVAVVKAQIIKAYMPSGSCLGSLGISPIVVASFTGHLEEALGYATRHPAVVSTEEPPSSAPDLPTVCAA